MQNGHLEFPCLEIEQPIGKFYLAIIDSRDLIRISSSDIRRLIAPELDRYLGIQRRLSSRRVLELERYVNLPDATFPNSIVLAISSDDATFDAEKSLLKIRNDPDVAKIIDGQHRIAGLERFEDERFQLATAIFVDMDVEDQASVFATINLAQSQVNKSLLYDLYEYAKKPSPHKTAHNIARLLNSKDGSPLRDRIKILGTARPELRQRQTLTQATIAEAILELISGSVDDANRDRDMIKMGKKLERTREEERQSLIFRELFIDGKDAEIARTLWNYLSAIRQRWPEAWDSTDPRYILARKTGFRAFMRVLPIIRQKLTRVGIPTEDEFGSILNRLPFKAQEFTRESYLHSKEGEDLLFDALVRAIS